MWLCLSFCCLMYNLVVIIIFLTYPFTESSIQIKYLFISGVIWINKHDTTNTNWWKYTLTRQNWMDMDTQIWCLLTITPDPDDPEQVTSQTRRLGLVVIRGTQVSLVSPEDGTEEIANPFLGGVEEEEVEGWWDWCEDEIIQLFPSYWLTRI